MFRPEIIMQIDEQASEISLKHEIIFKNNVFNG